MNARKTTILSVISLVFAIPIVSAQTASARILEGPFRMILEWLHNSTIVFGFTFIFFFMLLYGIYATGLKFVPAFKSDKGLSRQGKVVAISLAGLSTLSIFYFTRGGIVKTLETILDPFGIFAGIALAALFAGITYFGIKGGDKDSKSLGLTAAAAGFGMVLAGMITTRDNIMMWGWFIMLMAMIFGLIFSKWKGGGHDDGHGGGSHDDHGKGDGGKGDGGHGDGGSGSKGDGKLDYANPGYVYVQVTGEDNSGVPDAHVTIQAGHFGKRLFKDRTNNNGLCPKGSPAMIPSGHVIVIVTKSPGWIAGKLALPILAWPFANFGANRQEKPVFIYPTTPDKPQIISVQLRRKSEKADHFEPIIENVEYNPENTERPYTLKGRIIQK